MTYLVLEPHQVIAIHEAVLFQGDLTGLAGDKSLEGALGRVGNRLAYGFITDVFELAAAYAAVIAQGRCFNDGNKRAAFQTMDIVLQFHGVSIEWPTEAVGLRIVELAQARLDEDELAAWLRELASRATGPAE